MQCKDIPDLPILKLLADNQDKEFTWFAGFENSIQQAMPDGVPEKLALRKMNSLINRGLVDGCGCGCRGDFEITMKGLKILQDSQTGDPT